MKKITFLLAVLCLSTASAQLSFYIDGQQVDNSQVYLYEAGGLYIQPQILIENTSGDSLLDMRVDLCMIEEATEIDHFYLLWIKETDLFGGAGFYQDLAQDSCWNMPEAGGSWLDLANSERGLLALYINLDSVGCEKHRYYVVSDGGGVDSLDIEFCSTLGLESIEANSISIFPNPVSEYFQFNATEPPIEQLEIYSLEGQLVCVFETPESGVPYPISDLKPGNYLAVFTRKNAVSVTRKFQVVR